MWKGAPYGHATRTASEEAKDWTKPAAMAIPKGGFFKGKVEQGRYGPIFPMTPACYGFSVIAKVIPGREEHIYNHANVKFFREHQCPGFLEYSEHPYVSCKEIKKALKLKAAFSTTLDLMQ